MNLLTFSITTLLAVISTATAQEQVYNQIQASRGATSGASPYQHQHHYHERQQQQQQQQQQRAQQLRGGRQRQPSSASFLEAVNVDAGSCTNQCGKNFDDCCPGYTCLYSSACWENY